jgi:hypothetical protein
MKFLAVLVLALGLQAMPGGTPGALGQSLRPDDQSERAPDGEVVPLPEVFEMLRRRYGGYQVDAELFAERDEQTGRIRYHYRVLWMTGDGRRLRLDVNAGSGNVERQSLHVPQSRRSGPADIAVWKTALAHD